MVQGGLTTTIAIFDGNICEKHLNTVYMKLWAQKHRLKACWDILNPPIPPRASGTDPIYPISI